MCTPTHNNHLSKLGFPHMPKRPNTTVVCNTEGCTLLAARGGLCWTCYVPPSRTPKARKERRISADTPPVQLVFMPGMVPTRRNRLANMHRRALRKPTNHPTVHQEVEFLHQALRLKGNIFMPCAGTRGFVDAVESLYSGEISQVFCQDVDRGYTGLDSYGDVLAHTGLRARGFTAILTSPPFLIADLVLAWAVDQGVDVICLHVAGDYFSNAPLYRRNFLRQYEHNERMLCVYGLPIVRGRKMRRCMFLVLFRTKAVRQQSLRTRGVCTVFHNKVCVFYRPA